MDEGDRAAAQECGARERVFIDVGAHRGQSAAVALSPDYAFDRVISVEPDPAMVEALTLRFASEIAANRFTVAPFALSDEPGEAVLFGANAGGGASLVKGKFAAHDRERQTVPVLDWTAFVSRYDLGRAALYIKINAEGAEVAIIRSILRGPATTIAAMMIDFDIIKTPFGAWQKWRSVRALRAAGIPFDLAERVMVKRGPRAGLDNWLGDLAVARVKVARRPTPPMMRARIRYLELVSAVGIRHTLFKRARR